MTTAPVVFARVQEQLLQVEELIAKMEMSLASSANPRPSVSANIRALEKERRILQATLNGGQ